MLFRKIHIRQQERGVWFRDGDFRRLLAPGDHQLWSRFWTGRRDVILPADTLATRFDHALLDVMLAEPHVRDALHVVDLTDVERALVWKDERLAYVLGPGRHAFWKTPYRLYVETFRVDAGNFWFQHPRLAVVLKHPDAAKWLDAVQVEMLHYGQARQLAYKLDTIDINERPRSPGRRSTCASRAPTSPARRSSPPTRCRAT